MATSKVLLNKSEKKAERFTFHKVQDQECWQFKKRKEREAFYKTRKNFWDGKNFQVKDAIIKPVSRVHAEKIIHEYEWLGTMLSASQRFYGIFYDQFLAGVTCFGSAGWALPTMYKIFDVNQDDIAYLSRGACTHWAPKGSASKLISYSLKFEKKRGCKIAVAFSDTDAGEVGTVYQATNWVCLGKRDSGNSQLISPKGKLLSNQQITSYCKINHMKPTEFINLMKSKGWKHQITNPKFTYVFNLATDPKEFVRLNGIINGRKCPYPKRDQNAVMVQR